MEFAWELYVHVSEEQKSALLIHAWSAELHNQTSSMEI